MQMILFYDLMPWSKVTSIGPSTQIILVYDELKGPQKLPGKIYNKPEPLYRLSQKVSYSFYIVIY